MVALEVDHLVKAYGDTVALDGCSFDVQSGEIFGFVGSNPALVWLAARLYQRGVVHTGSRLRMRDALRRQP